VPADPSRLGGSIVGSNVAVTSPIGPNALPHKLAGFLVAAYNHGTWRVCDWLIHTREAGGSKPPAPIEKGPQMCAFFWACRHRCSVLRRRGPNHWPEHVQPKLVRCGSRGFRARDPSACGARGCLRDPCSIAAPPASGHCAMATRADMMRERHVPMVSEDHLDDGDRGSSGVGGGALCVGYALMARAMTTRWISLVPS
jgi:hypothetical protein